LGDGKLVYLATTQTEAVLLTATPEDNNLSPFAAVYLITGNPFNWPV
jgi:hypothetical protein